MFASAVAGAGVGVGIASLATAALQRRRLTRGIQIQAIAEQLERLDGACQTLAQEQRSATRRLDVLQNDLAAERRIGRELQEAVEVLERQGAAASERSQQLDAITAELARHAEALSRQDSLAAAIVELRQVITQLLMAQQPSSPPPATVAPGGPASEVAMMLAAQQRLQEAFAARAAQRNGVKPDPSAMGVPGAGGAGL